MGEIQVIVPAGMFGESEYDSALDRILRAIAVSYSTDAQEWADKYGINFENDTFLMHRFCWCEEEDCLWCGCSSCRVEYEHLPHREGCYQLRLREICRQYGEPLSEEFPDYWHVPYGSPNRKAYERAKRALCKELNRDYERGNEVHCTCGVDAERKAQYDACDCDWHAGRGMYRFGKATYAPNFWYKPLDFQVRWYKYIGRDVETNKPVTEEILTALARLIKDPVLDASEIS